jgi:predicted nucleic acid-binding protein
MCYKKRTYDVLSTVELTKALLILARDLMQRHPLRAFDAIHVASALSLKQEIGEALTIIAADERLLQAAEAEQLLTVNVERVQNSRGSN